MINLNNVFYIYANMGRNSKFLLTMIGLIIFLLVLIVIISLITRKKENKDVIKPTVVINKKKKINYDEESLEDLSPSVKISAKNDEVKVDTSKVNEPKRVEEIKKDDDVEVIEVMSDESDDIDEIKKLIENTLEQEPIRLNEFEQEQEDSAIISYDELVRKAGAKKIVYKTKKEEEKSIVKPVVEENKTAIFKPSMIVSPIYGIQKEESEKDEVLKSFEELENVKRSFRSTSNEMDNDVEFLNKLKKFRSELD